MDETVSVMRESENVRICACCLYAVSRFAQHWLDAGQCFPPKEGVSYLSWRLLWRNADEYESSLTF